MNSTLDSELGKTACFFLPEGFSSPKKSLKKSQHPFPQKVIKNIKMKRTSSQIELPRLTLYTEMETSTRDKRTHSNQLSANPLTPGHLQTQVQQNKPSRSIKTLTNTYTNPYIVMQQGLNTFYCRANSDGTQAQKCQSQSSSKEVSPLKLTLGFMRSNSRNGKSFLQSRPQQKLVTRIFGD